MCAFVRDDDDILKELEEMSLEDQASVSKQDDVSQHGVTQQEEATPKDDTPQEKTTKKGQKGRKGKKAHQGYVVITEWVWPVTRYHLFLWSLASYRLQTIDHELCTAKNFFSSVIDSG